MIEIRSLKEKDASRVYDFWKRNYKVSKRETKNRLKNFIRRNVGLSSLAEDDGEIVGTTLGSYDGRKGYIYKVVVKKDYRGTGLGQKLVKETVKKIKKAGCLDIRVNCAEDLVGFYKRCGFKLKEGLSQLQIKDY
jgi:ribosomal protein S18 acetylase RimI-like enzyme